MTLIDQRILVAAPAEAIWQYLTLPNWLPKWHQGCKQVSLLSTRSSGVGARRRCIAADRTEMVEEITGWLENIGYEYRVIDGPYRSFRGRFRLQPTAEGVIVNWTVEYAKRGLGRQLRDRLGGRRRVANQMAESLRALRKLVEKSGVRIDPERQSRYGMQRDPGFEARAARAGDIPRPEGAAALRPVVIGDDDLPAAPAMPSALPPTPEPSFVSRLSSPPPPAPSLSTSESSPKADTKPRKPKGLQEALERAGLVPPGGEGERYDSAKALTVPADLVAPKTPAPPTPPPAKPAATLADLNNAPTPPRGVPIPPKRESGTFTPVSPAMPPARPSAPITGDTPPGRDTGAVTPVPVPPAKPAPSRPSAPTPPRGIPTPKGDTGTLPPLGPVPPLAKRETGTITPVSPAMPPAPKRETGSMPATPEGGPPPGPKPTTIHDTGELSIWDVFGVQRPSERTRTDLQTIIASLQAPIGKGRDFPTKTARRPTLRRKPIRVTARPPDPRRRERGERRIRAKAKVRVR